MIRFSLKQLLGITKGYLEGANLTISKVSTNSKECEGALFIALIGERFDGHDFIDDAVEHGCVAVVSSRRARYLDVPVVYVKDTLRALGNCGMLVRDKFRGKLCSITGSCGKTTVKEMTAAICAQHGKTMYTQGNFNNDVGVPLTLLNLETDTKYAIIEQGASHLDDIARTCKYVKSRLALINNVGIAHVEGFGSKDNVYKGKSEILDAVFKYDDGVGIVNADNEYYDRWKKDYAKFYETGRLRSFGTAKDAFVRLGNVKQEGESLRFSLSQGTRGVDIGINILGEHNAHNAAAAAALALSMGFTLEEVRTGLNSYVPMGGRLNIVKTEPFRLIDDAYNASYNAVISAIDTLAGFSGRKVLIFADMKELGDEAVSAHEKVGDHARSQVDEILCFGELAKITAERAGDKAKHFNLLEDLLKYVQQHIISEKDLTILVKGSHSMGLDQVVKSLT